MLNILCRRIKNLIWPSFTFKAIKMTSGLKFFMSLPDKIIIIGEQGMVQRWELLPPTSVAWVQIPVWFEFVLVLSFGPRGFLQVLLYSKTNFQIPIKPGIR